MKIWTAITGLLLMVSSILNGQAVPAGVATATPDPFLPPVDGSVHYALTASELVQYGYYGPGQLTETTAISGEAAYQNKSASLPFSLLFSGSVLLPNQQGQGVTTYQNISVSQGLVTRALDLQCNGFFWISASVSDDRFVGRRGCRGSWRDPDPGTSLWASRRSIVRVRRPDRQFDQRQRRTAA